jgi:hypothetical protein
MPDDLSIPGAEPFRNAALPRCESDRRKGPEIDLASALKIALVIELLDGRVGRIAVGEVVCKLERANSRLDPLRSGLDSCRHGLISFVVFGWIDITLLNLLDVRLGPGFLEERLVVAKRIPFFLIGNC